MHHTFNPAPATRKLAKMVTIKRRDDFVVIQLMKPDQKIFFMRESDGSTTVIWEGDNVDVESFGSAAERRALNAKHLKESQRRRVALRRERK